MNITSSDDNHPKMKPLNQVLVEIHQKVNKANCCSYFEIDLSDNYLNDTAFEELACFIISCPVLRKRLLKLNVHSNQLSYQSLTKAKYLLQQTKFLEINLGANGIQDNSEQQTRITF